MRALFGAGAAFAFAASAYFFISGGRLAEGVGAFGFCLLAFALSFRWPAGTDHDHHGAP